MSYRNWNKSAYSYNEQKKRFEFKKGLEKERSLAKKGIIGFANYIFPNR